MRSTVILAEDRTDADTLRVLVRRLRPKAEPVRGISVHGKGNLVPKGAAHLAAARREGATHAILLADLDRHPQTRQRNDLGREQARLSAIECPPGLVRHVCIAVEELEAWFWSDPEVVRRVGQGKGEAHDAPESLRDPKDALLRLSRRGGRERYSTQRNPELAGLLDLDLCARRCPAFRGLCDFLRG